VPAIVLCNTVTGIATVRALAECGVEVHACLFRADDPLHESRYALKIACYHLHDDPAGLIEFLIDYAGKLGNRPVVLPTCDAHALLLAKYADQLTPHCRIWQLPHEQLTRLVDKTQLYEAARAAGVPTIPSLATPSQAQLLEWSRQHPGPYILKPGYAGIGSCKLPGKNLVLQTREQLLAYVRNHGAESLVVQRLLRGGDGNIFDCYGLCDANGRVVCLTSHQRIRQYPPNFGSTSMGEIPAPLPTRDEQFLFAATERLFNDVKFHGIFGIEWLREDSTGAFYLIDFNARPFLTIGHLRDCGVNLPLLAYRDLVGESLAAVPPRPAVRRKRWVFIAKDIETFRKARESGQPLGLVPWLRSVASCSSFAYVSFRDPIPGLLSIVQIVGRSLRYLGRAGREKELASAPNAGAPVRIIPR
jgi:predicted ATP-grasp superfamily ATP-dependent carboligase